jgi:hypothetical protein
MSLPRFLFGRVKIRTVGPGFSLSGSTLSLRLCGGDLLSQLHKFQRISRKIVQASSGAVEQKLAEETESRGRSTNLAPTLNQNGSGKRRPVRRSCRSFERRSEVGERPHRRERRERKRR